MRDTSRAVVAVDGPAGSGKSTVARLVAERLGWRYVDTGAMYRAMTLALLDAGLAARLDDQARVTGEVRRSLALLELGTSPHSPTVRLADRDVTEEIRGPAVTAAVSAVSALPAVRELLVQRQRDLAATGGVVVEGRDIGTTVLPDAPLKVYLDADPSVRAARRAGEEPAVGSTDQVAAALARRDAADSARSVSPLRIPPDAVVIDTSAMTVENVVSEVLALARQRGVCDQAERTAPDRKGEWLGRGLPASRATVADSGPTPGTAPSGAPATAAEPAPRVALGAHLLRAAIRWLASRWLRVTVHGQENLPAGPLLVCSPHTGAWDGPLLFLYFPRYLHLLAKAELYRWPLSRVLDFVGQVPVHRGRPDRPALRLATQLLRGGSAVGIFPEGTRGSGGLTRVADGVGYLALRTGASVVPVLLTTEHGPLPHGSWWPRRGTRVELTIGPPVPLPPVADPRSRAAAAVTSRAVQAALADLTAESQLAGQS